MARKNKAQMAEAILSTVETTPETNGVVTIPEPVVETAAPTVSKVPTTKVELTDREIRILQALLAGEMGRAALKEATGIASGLASIIGAVTKDDGGVAGEDGLATRKLVLVKTSEEQRGVVFAISAKGRKLLEKVKAATTTAAIFATCFTVLA